MWSFKISDFPHFSSFGFAKKTSLLCNLGFFIQVFRLPKGVVRIIAYRSKYR